jgi:Protein of unknown function, DUF547
MRSNPILEMPARRLGKAILGYTFAIVAIPTIIAADGSPIDLTLYDRVLKSHTRSVDEVVGVRVDYAAIAKDAEWERLVRQVQKAIPSQLDREEQLAFWINAYNILTIDLVAEHYPVAGIKDIGSFFSPVWDIEVATIEGRSISLGGIEHETLRPMGEPRIHAAIVCASISCPPLSRTAFRAETLEEDLSKAMRAWLGNPGKGIRIDRTRRRITISKIFDWFEEDFEADGGVLAWIARYVSSDDAHWIRGEGAKSSIRFFDYDWSLNDVED